MRLRSLSRAGGESSAGASIGVLLLAPLLAAQEPVPPEPATAREWIAETYDSERSWALFAGCDTDADDRLSVFEAGRALPYLEQGRNRAAYRQLDADADGFVQWPEFDARFRFEIRTQGRFRVFASRPVPESPRTSVPDDVDPTREVLGNFDDDLSGALDRDEFLAFLAAVQLPAQLLEHFDTLDTDASGAISESEFRPALQFVPQIWTRRRERDARADLPPHMRAADLDGDGVLGRDELERALRRLDPALARWTGVVLRGADRSSNGSLGAAELRSAERSAREGAGIPDTPP